MGYFEWLYYKQSSYSYMFELKDFNHLFFSNDAFYEEELSDSPIYLSSFSKIGPADEELLEVVNKPCIIIGWLWFPIISF